MEESNKTKSFGIGGYRGRIIFLGDGTEVLTDSDDTEMFDNSEEDKDLLSGMSKASSSETDSKDASGEEPTEAVKTEEPKTETSEDAKTEPAAAEPKLELKASEAKAD